MFRPVWPSSGMVRTQFSPAKRGPRREINDSPSSSAMITNVYIYNSISLNVFSARPLIKNRDDILTTPLNTEINTYAEITSIRVWSCGSFHRVNADTLRSVSFYVGSFVFEFV
jgi:hypothetical protein